jgi:hypothetical protein
MFRPACAKPVGTRRQDGLAVWLDGIVEFETSDGAMRYVSAGGLCWWRKRMERATSHVTQRRARA